VAGDASSVLDLSDIADRVVSVARENPAEVTAEVADLTVEEIARTVGTIASKYPVIKVVLFGSRARGDHRPDSDVDLYAVLDHPRGMGGLWLGALYDDLDQAFPTGVDLVTSPLETMTSGRRRLLAKDIREEGVTIYERPA
jgi:predicted nucleotidyltransferase